MGDAEGLLRAAADAGEVLLSRLESSASAWCVVTVMEWQGVTTVLSCAGPFGSPAAALAYSEQETDPNGWSRHLIEPLWDVGE